MEKRVAVIGIIVENADSAPQVNEILHGYSEFIVGRMGIPYTAKELHIISIAVDAPMDIINAISGKVGKIPGVSAKAVCSAK